MFAGTILWIPMISKLSAKYGKQEVYMLFIGLWVVIQAVGISKYYLVTLGGSQDRAN